MGADGFCGPWVGVYFCCCSGGCFVRIVGAGVVYSWYRRLVSGW
jgi:hypothetical protein